MIVAVVAGGIAPQAAFAATPTGYAVTSGWLTTGTNATAAQIGGTTYLGPVTATGTNQTVAADPAWLIDGTAVPRRQFTTAAVTASTTACLNGSPVDTVRVCNGTASKITTINFPRAVVNPIIALGARGALATVPTTGTTTKTYCATSWTDHTVTAISGSAQFSRSQVTPVAIAAGQRYNAATTEVYFDPTVMEAAANECLVPATGTGTVSYIQIMGVVESVQFETRWRSMVTRNNTPVQTTRTSATPPGWQFQALFTQADLAVTKTATAQVPATGELEWRLGVTNKGTGPSHGFQVDDVVPLGVTGVSVVSSPVPCTIGTETIAGVARQVVHCASEPPDCIVVPDASTPGWADTLCDNDGVLVPPVLAAGGSFGPIVIRGFAGPTTGTISNTATVSGNDMDPVRTDNTATAATQVVAAAPAISLSAAVAPPGPAVLAVGTSLSYTFRITNTGNIPLTSAVVVESGWDGDGTAPVITCPSTAIAAGATADCTATHLLTQAEIDRGSVALTGTALGASAAGDVTSTAATATTLITRSSGLGMTASASVTQMTAVGQTVTYTYVVTNTGLVTLSGVGVTESAFTGTGTAPVVSCAPTVVAPGASSTCTSSYVSVVGDTPLTEITIDVAAHGVAPTGVATPTGPQAIVRVAMQIPAMTFTKIADVASGSTIERGQSLTYTVTATNAGGAVLSPVTITDDLSGVLTGATFNGDLVALLDGLPTSGASASASGVSWTGSLDPGSVVTLTYSVTATTASATLRNDASAAATAPGGVQLAPPAVSTTHSVRAALASFTLSAGASVAQITAVGQPITYTYVVTNTGNVTLSSVGAVESAFTGTGIAPTVSCAPLIVVPTATSTCTSSYTVVAGDTHLTQLSLNVAADGTAPAGVTAPAAASSVVLVEMRIPALAFTKTSNIASGSTIDRGQIVRYTLTARNVGGTVLSPVTIVDDLRAVLTGAKFNGDATVSVDGVAAGAVAMTASRLSWTGSLAAGSVAAITYSVTPDTEGATLRNEASATATAAGSVQLSPPAASTTHTVRAADPAVPPTLPLEPPEAGGLAGTGVDWRQSMLFGELGLILGLLGGALVVVSKRREMTHRAFTRER